VKNVIFSLVVICALAVAGIGGTLADFSDSEEEIGDTLQAGSLDLKVNGEDDPNVLPFAIRGIIPDKQYDVTKTVKNVGTIDGWLYIHMKNPMCHETNDKDLNGDGVIDALDKPEPEKVAEFGGKIGQVDNITGLGERCDMEKHIEVVKISFGPTGGNLTEVDLSQYDANGDNKTKLDEIACNQVLLGQLVGCGAPYNIEFRFVLQDVPESYWGVDYFDETDPHEIKWDHWPTNCYQGDTVTFDVLFELLQTDYTPPGG
jgi:predicted ribosomally synthesized peptide with SipW-like signal peptide